MCYWNCFVVHTQNTSTHTDTHSDGWFKKPAKHMHRFIYTYLFDRTGYRSLLICIVVFYGSGQMSSSCSCCLFSCCLLLLRLLLHLLVVVVSFNADNDLVDDDEDDEEKDSGFWCDFSKNFFSGLCLYQNPWPSKARK